MLEIDNVAEEPEIEVEEDVEEEPKPEQYQCPKCTRCFTNIGFFKCHFYRVHPEFRLTAFMAEEAPPPKKRPIQQKMPTSVKVCEECKLEFPFGKQLSTHLCEGTKEDGKFTCDFCEKRFMKKENLVRHCLQPHTCKSEIKEEKSDHASKNKGFTCDVCHKIFSQRSSLNNHVLCHVKDKLFECEVCQKKFAKLVQLQMHKKTHEEKSFKCATCKEIFQSRAELKKHMQTHIVNPYVCEICNESFESNLTLKTHFLSHKEVNPFACTVCDERFSRQLLLKRHIATHSAEELRNPSNHVGT